MKDRNQYLIVFGINKQGHHKNYCTFFEKAFKAKTVYSLGKQIRELYKDNMIFFLDGDKLHLLFIPLVIIRNLLGKESIFLSIRSEQLFRNTTIAAIKRILFRFLRKLKYTKTISIHKISRNKRMDKYIDDYIHDIQYWDISWLKIEKVKPPELINFKTTKPVLLVAGKLNNKRSKQDLLNELTHNRRLNYSIIFSGKMNSEDYNQLSRHKDCIVINRYVEDEELMYLYKIADIIYCYYDSDFSQRPSGLFGRALQLGKYSLVKRFGYLHIYHQDYEGLIDVADFSEFNTLMGKFETKALKAKKYDDYKSMARILKYSTKK